MSLIGLIGLNWIGLAWLGLDWIGLDEPRAEMSMHDDNGAFAFVCACSVCTGHLLASRGSIRVHWFVSVRVFVCACVRL